MLCVTAQLKPEPGGLGGNVLYFDTEGTFSSNRVYQIAAENGLDSGQTPHNIILSRVYTSDHQMFLLDNAFEKCAEENVNSWLLTRSYPILEANTSEGKH